MNTIPKPEFEKWMHRESWASSHENDDSLFYVFAHQAFLNGTPPFIVSEAIKEKIEERYPNWHQAVKDDSCIKFSARYEEIYHFLKHIGYST